MGKWRLEQAEGSSVALFFTGRGVKNHFCGKTNAGREREIFQDFLLNHAAPWDVIDTGEGRLFVLLPEHPARV